MPTKKKNDTALAVCIQEITEDGSELNLGDDFSLEALSYLHQAFIADTINNILDITGPDFYMYYADYPHTRKSVETIMHYLAGRFNGKKAKVLEEKLKVQKLDPERWGLKMDAVFRQCFERGYKHVIFIGSRTPTLNGKMLTMAIRLLKNSDAVFGPTVEGRYYLIGMSGQYHVNLADFDWKSPRIYSEVAEKFNEKGLSWSEMEMWYAVEHPEDLEFLVRDINQYRLEGDEEKARETEKVLERILNRQL